MEEIQKRSTNACDSWKTAAKLKDTILNSIHNEYCLKRNKFNPEQPSPNVFCNRLEIRMKTYYNNLYKSFKL